MSNSVCFWKKIVRETEQTSFDGGKVEKWLYRRSHFVAHSSSPFSVYAVLSYADANIGKDSAVHRWYRY